MKLEEIGFYTLEDRRAKETNMISPYWRCELVLTDRCNFNCTYCRGVKKEYRGTMNYLQAKKIVKYWSNWNLKNIRFTGGEPTLISYLPKLISYSSKMGISGIAISTNGSADFELYNELLDYGVNDFSISLDACCAATAKIMSGGKSIWKKIIKNIEELSKLTYVTIGVVLTNENIIELEKIIEFASDSLGVSDIRIVPAAQWDQYENFNFHIRSDILKRHPILKYRVENIHQGRKIRGITKEDYHYCPLVIDDMAVISEFHFPCIIYLREGGNPIGRIDSKRVRWERFEWFQKHNTFRDSICRRNCLDVCIDYNNKVSDFR